MSKSLKTFLLLLSFLILAFAVAGAAGVKTVGSNDGAYRQLGVYNDVLNRIRTDYVEEPNLPKVTDGALHGLMEALDANSSYLSPEEYKFYKQVEQAQGTIGVALSKRFGYGNVIATVPGGPADKAGVLDGDIIEAVDDKSVREISLAELSALMNGAPGTQVTLSVVRATAVQPQKITVTREAVKNAAATAKMLENQIGYVRADGFPKGRAQEIAARVHELEKSGARKLILDLRNSGDGDPLEGVATANLFLAKGQIGYLEGQKFPRQSYAADPAKCITALPLLVIVNRSTAGAAEIVAAAVLDNNRGDVLGDKTFGSASLQKTIDLPDGSALILSVAKYYTPSGKAIQDTMITPTVMVADHAEDFSAADEGEMEQPEQEAKPQDKKQPQPDEQLKKAIERLSGQGMAKAAGTN